MLISITTAKKLEKLKYPIIDSKVFQLDDDTNRYIGTPEVLDIWKWLWNRGIKIEVCISDLDCISKCRGYTVSDKDLETSISMCIDEITNRLYKSL